MKRSLLSPCTRYEEWRSLRYCSSLKKSNLQILGPFPWLWPFRVWSNLKVVQCSCFAGTQEMFVSHETPGQETPNLCQRLVAFYFGFFRTFVHSFGRTGS